MATLWGHSDETVAHNIVTTTSTILNLIVVDQLRHEWSACSKVCRCLDKLGRATRLLWLTL